MNKFKTVPKNEENEIIICNSYFLLAHGMHR